MKLPLLALLLVNITTCQKEKTMENNFRSTLERKKTIEIMKIRPGNAAAQDTAFYSGYMVTNRTTIGKKSIDQLVNLLSDSTNYIIDRSKNCPLNASYGLKLSNDSADYVVFIGKQPCLKISILEERKHKESIMDLTESNSIIPFFDSLFIEK